MESMVKLLYPSPLSDAYATEKLRAVPPDNPLGSPLARALGHIQGNMLYKGSTDAEVLEVMRMIFKEE